MQDNMLCSLHKYIKPSGPLRYCFNKENRKLFGMAVENLRFLLKVRYRNNLLILARPATLMNEGLSSTQMLCAWASVRRYCTHEKGSTSYSSAEFAHTEMSC